MENSTTSSELKLSAIIWEFISLTKPRVNLLIMFTAIVGMLLAQDTNLNYELILLASIGIGFAASAAAIINHVIDQRIDSVMERTKSRPLVQGNIKPSHAIYFAIFLSISSLTLLYIFVNTLTAILTFISIIIYSFVYSIYLKNLNSQNIVIGGIAGAMPPLLGWTSMTNQIDPFPLILFLIIFLWTPPHFWALAVYKSDDYKKANVPMLPVTHGKDFARLHIFLYSILLLCISIFPYLLNFSGAIYFFGTLLIGFKFVYDAFMLMRTKSDNRAIKLFRYSITYLALLFGFLLLDYYYYLS